MEVANVRKWQRGYRNRRAALRGSLRVDGGISVTEQVLYVRKPNRPEIISVPDQDPESWITERAERAMYRQKERQASDVAWGLFLFI